MGEYVWGILLYQLTCPMSAAKSFYSEFQTWHSGDAVTCPVTSPDQPSPTKGQHGSLFKVFGYWQSAFCE